MRNLVINLLSLGPALVVLIPFAIFVGWLPFCTPYLWGALVLGSLAAIIKSFFRWSPEVARAGAWSGTANLFAATVECVGEQLTTIQTNSLSRVRLGRFFVLSIAMVPKDYLDLHKDPITIRELGHTNAGLIYSNYRELVTPQAAARYWNDVSLETGAGASTPRPL